LPVLAVVHHRNAAAGVFADAAGDLVEWLPHESPPPRADGFDAAIVFGADAQVDQEESVSWLRPEKQLVRELLDRGTPILGVCLGSQLVAEAAGAQPHRMGAPEIGWYEIEITDAGAADPLLGPLAPSVELFQWHHYAAPLPPGAVELARTPASVQAFRIEGKPAWGLQFHAEVTKENLSSWLDGWENSEAVHTRFDPELIRAATELRIEEQNEIGRRLAERFLAEAARSAPS
jgi:GMP synthase (glutamine-hydrolysing)